MAEIIDTGNLLRQAALSGKWAKVKELVETGTSPDAPDRRGNSPLLYAAMHGFTEIVRFLIENGADVNAANLNGYTPLASSALRRNSEVLTLLLDAGAKPFARVCSLGEEGLLDAEIVVASPEEITVIELQRGTK